MTLSDFSLRSRFKSCHPDQREAALARSNDLCRSGCPGFVPNRALTSALSAHRCLGPPVSGPTGVWAHHCLADRRPSDVWPSALQEFLSGPAYGCDCLLGIAGVGAMLQAVAIDVAEVPWAG